ncbi:MAG: FAD-binding protein [Patescibacteria group bacterium]
MKVIEKLEEVIGSGRIRQQESLATHTLDAKEGIAEFYTEIDTVDDLVKLVRQARLAQVSVFILGSGSSITIPKEGVQGLVIKNNCHRFDTMSVRGTMKGDQMGVRDIMISAESGVLTNQLVRFTLEEGLEGLEYQLGLPGTVGGAIATNAKYSSPTVPAKYVKDFLYSMRILHEDGEIQTYTKDLPYFILDEAFETKDVILSVAFKLLPGDKKVLWESGQEAVEYRNKFKDKK